jgi:phenylpyruvate tautomerase PptA (4-oxalocrotonate tautomerase family)
MPLLKIQTNVATPAQERTALLKGLSASVAEMLGKPENYVMLALEHNPDMLFAGSSDPLAYLELKSIGLPAGRTKEFSAQLCSLVSRELDIAAERIYIEFADAERGMWGWKGATFER